MNMLPFFLAWRYLWGNYQEKTISTMVLICFLGIFIGTCALALVTFVTQGFEQTTYQKLQGIHAPIIIRSCFRQALDAPRIQEVIAQEFPHVQAILAPVAVQYALAQSLEDTHDNDDYSLIMIKGIDPIQESQVTTLATTIIEQGSTYTNLASLLGNKGVLIGSCYARDHMLAPGDTIQILLPEPSARNTKTICFTKNMVRIAGIFNTGIDDFDTSVLFCSLPFFQELFPDTGISSIGVKLQHQGTDQEFIAKLRSRLDLSVVSWKELYPALVSALMLEKYAMFFVLALITLVAGMSIVSLLFMLITQKRADIALLKSMGLSDTAIAQVFIIIGMVIATLSCILGLVSAIIIAYLLDTYQLIPLPDMYYTTHLPATISWPVIACVFLLVMLIGFVASWWPTRATRTINIAHVLRFEG
jgi:lipoprotein-releasing system permease protein